MTHRTFAIVAVAILSGLCARTAQAQAWVPPKGEGSVSVLYQDLLVEKHFLAGGGKIDRGHIRSNNLLFDVTYGLTDRMTVTLVVPYISTEYSGTFPHPTPQDNGKAHSAFQDVRFGVRYNIVDSPVLTITPFVGSNMPTHNYEYFAHAAYGTRVRELEVGTYVGRMIGPALPNTFVQARYSYSFAERIAGIHHDRSNLDLEVGHLITPKVRAFVIGAGQTTHGGIDTPDAGWRAMPPELAPHHDRVARLQMLDVGGGVQVSVSRSVEVFGSYVKTLAGRNAHALSRGITIGASWSFGRRAPSLVASSSGNGNDDDEGTGARESLIKCLCQK
jgi:hypothetical protein